MELVSKGKKNQSPHQYHASSFQSSHSDSITKEDEELELQWAAIERLPAFKQLQTSLFDSEHSNGSRTGSEGKRAIDVTKLGALERHVFIEKIIKHIEKDNLLLLQKQRERIER